MQVLLKQKITLSTRVKHFLSISLERKFGSWVV
jgi:hypothetical protein